MGTSYANINICPVLGSIFLIKPANFFHAFYWCVFGSVTIS